METFGEVTFTGRSGKQYRFETYPLGTTFQPIGGVYFLTKRTGKPGGGWHADIYVGEAADLSQSLETHRKANCFEMRGANCISIHPEESATARQAIVADLIAAYGPPCNE
ncbi:hypothetical protein [Nitrospira sp. Kam-Ns4a]